MNDREKLMADIAKARCKAREMGLEGYWAENAVIVDHLIANGVTVQKWIPVTERLPSKEEYIAYTVDDITFYRRMVFIHKTDTIEYDFGCYDGHKWICEWNYVVPNVVAWMPLPEPPKEGE